MEHNNIHPDQSYYINNIMKNNYMQTNNLMYSKYTNLEFDIIAHKNKNVVVVDKRAQPSRVYTDLKTAFKHVCRPNTR